MEYELIPVNFNKVMQSKSYTVFILSCERMQFAIYMDPHVGQNIQIYITEKKYPRPLTHDMMHFIFDGFDIELLQIVITDVQDTVYYARLYLQQQINDNYKILEIDTRPSDCLPLALIKNIPIYCRRDVLTKIIPLRD